LRMELKDVLTLAFDRWSATMTLWSLYVVVVGAIIGFVASSKRPLRPTFKFIIAAVFIYFTLANLFAQVHVLGQRRLLLSMIPATAPYASDWQKKLEVEDNSTCISFHLVLDMVTILVVLDFPFIRKGQISN
jgi:hypothetical protein